MTALRFTLPFLIPLALMAQGDPAAFFETKVRPLLIQKCLGCHSSTSQPIMGGLRLDSREALLKGGTRGAAVVPGKPAESLLMKVVLHTAGPLKMPPGPKLKDAELAYLAQWIEMGAPWGGSAMGAPAAAKFWSLLPPVKAAPPAVRNTAWVKTPIDQFVLAALEAKGLAPAPPADKRTLLRRVTYNLTGLPPTPQEMDQFLADASPDAYAKVVDRLLASPRYGERWGRHWLDVARYADSNGLDENLVYKNAFRYRDYVIASFNEDKPFNQFLQEQIAGDLLPPTTDLKQQFARWTATGFLSLGAKMLAEDDPKKMEMDIVDEQLDTTARAFMGLTVGCARCHDHKFDPIPTKDYYALAGIFKSSKTMEHFNVVAKWHEYVLAPKEDRDRLAAHEAKIEAKNKEIGALTRQENKVLTDAAAQQVGAYLLASRRLAEHAAIQVAPVETERSGIVLAADAWANGNVARKLERKKDNTNKGVPGPYFVEYNVTAPKAGLYQLDILSQERGAGTPDLHVNGIWQRRGDPAVQNREASPETDGWRYVAMIPLAAGANTIRLEHARRMPYFEKLLLTPNTLPLAPQTSVQIARELGVNPSILDQLVDFFDRSQGAPSSPFYAWETLADAAQGPQVAAQFEARFRRAATEAGKTEAELKPLRALLEEKFGPFRAPADARRYYPAAAQAQLKTLEKERDALVKATPDFPRAMGVMENSKIEDIPVHLRGSHWTLGPTPVPRHVLSALSTQEPTPMPAGESGRLQLAQWMTSPGHPLTSRVIANRVWRWHFGRGIVATVDNFGRLGEKPSNQPLLDWLAVTMVEQGWSLKAMHRLILLSNVYQQSSDYNAKAYETDPENILLWRMPRRRLEAEAIRDGIMSASGGLKLDAGGSILKYKDRQYVANTSKGGDVDYDRPIRSVYIPVLRSSMYEVFSAFDLPDPTTSNGDRDATVVAPQALFMLNSSVMLRHSRIMADSLLALPASDSERLTEAYRRALSRPPTPKEIDDGLSFLEKMRREWNGDNAKAWQSLLKSLLAASEMIYLN